MLEFQRLGQRLDNLWHSSHSASSARNSTRDLNALPEEYDALTTIERRTPGEEWGTEAVFGDRDFLPGEFAVNLTNSNQVVALIREGRILQRAAYGVYLTVNVLAYFRAKR